MKIISFLFFNIFVFNLTSSKFLKISDIFKGNKFRNVFNLINKTKYLNSTRFCNQKDQKDLEKPSTYSNYSRITRAPITDDSKQAITIFKNDQENVNTKDNSFENIEKGSLFMALCVKGGLTSNEQILNAYEWALKNNYIINQNKVNMSWNDFAQKISEKFKSIYHFDWKIRNSFKEGHYNVIDSKFNIIYDSTGFKNNVL